MPQIASNAALSPDGVAHRDCGVCGADDIERIIDFKLQPVAASLESLTTDPTMAESPRYPLSLGCCRKCGTVQLCEAFPAEALSHKLNWMKYSEPENHLDDLAKVLADLADLTAESRILGISEIDQSMLERLEGLGYPNHTLLDFSKHPEDANPQHLAGIAQSLSADTWLRGEALRTEGVDLLVMRRMLEHVAYPARLLRTLKRFIRPGGLIVIEVPSAEKMLKNGNHALVWEEHLTYFTAASIHSLAGYVGAHIEWLCAYASSYEDSLVAVLSFPAGAQGASDGDPMAVADSRRQLDAFRVGLFAAKARWREQLRKIRQRGQRVAVFGAGHHAVKFINFLELSDFIDVVVDDHPAKIGLRVPGSRLPIVSSQTLAEMDIRYCISTLAPETETKVRAKLAAFLAGGGVFLPAMVADE